MATPQEFIFSVGKKKLNFKIDVPFFSVSSEDCGSWRRTNPGGVLNILR